MSEYYHGLIVQPDCHQCPLQFDTKVLPDGPSPTRLCFVGEGPGYNEVQEGKGFVGASGQLLWHLAEAKGVTRDMVWVTNGALCKPREVRLSSGAILSETLVKSMSVNACRRRLIGELLAVTQGDPMAVIVPLGNLALQALSPRKGGGIFKYRGSLQNIDLQELWNQVNI